VKGELLLLRPVKKENKPTKTLDKNLEKVSDFNAGFKFYFKTIQYENNFHETIKEILSDDEIFLVLGELTEQGKSLEEERKAGRRLKRTELATIQDKNGYEIVLDLDDHIIPDFDALKPHKAIKQWLKEKNINCDVTVQITSSQKLNTNEARIRLYFLIDKKLPLQIRKAWSQSPEIGADGCVFTCSQPIYTAPPVIQRIEDPIKRRSFFLKGTERFFNFPDLKKEEIEKYKSAREVSEYDYTLNDLPQVVVSGQVYRRYFMPLAFSLVNKGLDRESIFAIIKEKSKQVPSRDFDSDNVYQYIDTALEQYENEDHNKAASAAEIIKPKHSEKDFPEFPKDLLATFPEPFPMIWENMKNIPRVLEEPLLVPTVLSLLGHCLYSNFVTEWGRRPNMFYLNLTPSTGNKDVNSKNVIRSLDDIFVKRGAMQNIFTGIINTASNVTADISFLQSFSEQEEFFWINTEATRIFHMLKSGGSSNSNVAAISDKLIEVVDGYEITGKIKANQKNLTIKNPKCQVLFYAQPETIERHIDEQMVDSGLFGRALISILPELKFNAAEYSMFKKPEKNQSEVSQEFYDFFTSDQFRIIRTNAQKTILKLSDENRMVMDKWAREVCGAYMEGSDTYQKVLSRLGNTGEQLYVIVLGICRLWDLHKKQKVREEIDAKCILPLLTYWCETKVYAIENYISTALDPMAEEVESVLQDALNGAVKMSKPSSVKILKAHNMIPLAEFNRIIKNRKKLINKLSDSNDKRDAFARIERLIYTLERNDILILKEIEGRKCIGFRK
jgi:hypothetical protein